MGFEQARELPEIPGGYNPEAPMSREILALKNSIQSELISYMIPPGKDVEEYPFEWIKDHSGDFHEEFVNFLRERPTLMEDWNSDDKKDDIKAYFARNLSIRLNK